MKDTDKKVDEKNGGDILKRMLKSPPDHKTPPKPKPGKEKGSEDARPTP